MIFKDVISEARENCDFYDDRLQNISEHFLSNPRCQTNHEDYLEGSKRSMKFESRHEADDYLIYVWKFNEFIL
jgi:hypothetical protein